MNAEEALRICRLAKAISPAQAVDDFTPEAWAVVLRPHQYADAELALEQLGGEQEWIHVSHVVRRIKRIRAGRLSAFGDLPAPPADLADRPVEYQAWQADLVRRIADGRPVERPALAAAGERPDIDLSGVLKSVDEAP